ncbi:hypothetical protein XENTR_v10005793 [Xenopus tropicalis]|nr:hypothetical protein XENTR_v10005793 [Xenopus tropicalis]
MLGNIRFPTAQEALPGRSDALQVADKHMVNGNSTLEPFPDGLEIAVFGMGCFWGAERLFWKQEGVYSTQVGFAGGHTPNPTYKEVRTGLTAHAEVVRVVFDPKVITYKVLLKLFWENHDPTEVYIYRYEAGRGCWHSVPFSNIHLWRKPERCCSAV